MVYIKQQEPRCLASIADEHNMQETYRKGKDLYSTMAAEAYHVDYKDCLEFYLDENGNKTDLTNPEGKKRRSSIKGVLLGEYILCPIKMTWTSLLLGVLISISANGES